MRQLTASERTQIASKKEGTIPGPVSKRNRRITPPTIIGVTIPRKIADLTIDDPLTSRRMRAIHNPNRREMGRWIVTQSALWINVPKGGGHDRFGLMVSGSDKTAP